VFCFNLWFIIFQLRYCLFLAAINTYIIMTQQHSWSFSMVGGVKRVNLETGEDLVHLPDLDPKLWTALSCPVHNLEIDRHTLELIDTDHDGHIRVPEVLEAVRWITSLLKEPDDLLGRENILRLDALNEENPEAIVLVDAARIILHNLGKDGQEEIALEDAKDIEKIFQVAAFNGDGVITEDSTQDAVLRVLIEEIKATVGSVADRGGKQGIDEGIITRFFASCTAYLNWQQQRENEYSKIMPFGEQTADAYAAYTAVRPKLEDYFLRCRLLSYDADAANALNLQTVRIIEITKKDLHQCTEEIETYPLARIGESGKLDLNHGLNPAWQERVQTFCERVVTRIFSEIDTLDETGWKLIKNVLAPYEAWLASCAGQEVAGLGIDRIQHVNSSGYEALLLELVAQDKAVADEAAMPVFEFFDNPAWAYGGGLYHIQCNYLLMIDNLMDLTHETYVHSTSIGQQEIDETPSRTVTEGDCVTTSRFMEGIKAPPFWQMAMRANDLPDDAMVDRWQICRFTPPSHVLIEVGVALAGKGGYHADPKDKASSVVVDFITPETETSHWYFWGMARRFKIEDRALTDSIRTGQAQIFAEDMQMLQRPQANLSERPGQRLLNLNIDSGGVHARNMITRAIANG
jgi:hypothetical protein